MKTEENPCDGWTNRETRAVNRWMDELQSSGRYWRNEIRRHSQNAFNDEKAIHTFAQQLKEEVYHDAPLNDPDIYVELLTIALSVVNWNEIAKNWLSRQVH